MSADGRIAIRLFPSLSSCGSDGRHSTITKWVFGYRRVAPTVVIVTGRRSSFNTLTDTGARRVTHDSHVVPHFDLDLRTVASVIEYLHRACNRGNYGCIHGNRDRDYLKRVLAAVFVDDSSKIRAVQESLTLPDGTPIPVVITLDGNKLFHEEGD